MADGTGSPQPGLANGLTSVWRALDRNQRLAGGGATVLLLSLFLPWFQQTGLEQVQARGLPAGAPTTRAVTISLSGFQAFSWIEAAVMLVGLGVLALLYARGDRRPFHLPGGDGAVIATAGGWSAFLIAYRVLFFKPLHVGLDTGVDWGLLVALAGAGTLIVAGLRIHSANRPEPPNPAAESAASATVAVEPEGPSPEAPPASPAASGTQLRFGEVEAPAAPAPEQPGESTGVDPTLEQQLEMPIDDRPQRRKRRRRDR